jgi:hypothetical protein
MNWKNPEARKGLSPNRLREPERGRPASGAAVALMPTEVIAAAYVTVMADRTERAQTSAAAMKAVGGDTGARLGG